MNPTFPLKVALRIGGLVLASTLGIAAQTAHAAEDRLVGLIEPVKASKPYRIGVTVVHLNDDFYKGIVYGIDDEAKRSGVEVVQVSIAGAYGNVREQFAQLEAFKTLKVDVAVVAPAAYNGYDTALKSLKDAGIKVVAAGIPVNSPNVAFGITQDDTAIGKVLADEICKTKVGGRIITVPGPAGAEWARLRYVGFMDEAKKCAGLVPTDGAFGGALGLQHGLTTTSDLLLRYPDTKYVYTPEISLAMGAAQAIRQQNKQVKVVSSSMVKEAVPMVKDGRLLAVVSEPGIIMGRLVVQYAIRQLDGKPTPGLAPADKSSPYPYFNVPTTLILPANVDKHPFEIYEIPPSTWKMPAVK
jgi:ribose transport system substrate-binding protein